MGVRRFGNFTDSWRLDDLSLRPQLSRGAPNWTPLYRARLLEPADILDRSCHLGRRILCCLSVASTYPFPRYCMISSLANYTGRFSTTKRPFAVAWRRIALKLHANAAHERTRLARPPSGRLDADIVYLVEQVFDAGEQRGILCQFYLACQIENHARRDAIKRIV